MLQNERFSHHSLDILEAPSVVFEAGRMPKSTGINDVTKLVANGASIGWDVNTNKVDVCVNGVRQGTNPKKHASDPRIRHPLCKAEVWKRFKDVLKVFCPKRYYILFICPIKSNIHLSL